jgi:acyl-[acyl-carrier-protein]-phospholipid O-acyltransferase/long-chain-fatty-acid--[acyl-carrier-protein] ligase
VPYPISIHIGTPLTPPHTLDGIERAVTRLGTKAVGKRNGRTPVLPQLMIRQCKRRGSRSKIADSSGADLSGYSTLMRALVLRRVLRREVVAADEHTVGVLLPPSVTGVVVNAALALDRRTSVNLNYTVSADVMNQCIRRAGIRRVITSSRFAEKLDFDLEAEVVYVEDLADKPTTTDKAVAALATFVTPARLLERLLNLHKIKRDDVLTIIFTSGTTGVPKGVMLTYGNVGSNCEGVEQMVRLGPSDVVMGILPFFHSFGYTVTIWAVLSLDIKGAYHYNPLDARQIGKLCEEHGGTFLIATPTFLRSYVRRSTPEQFATLDAVLTGAERLPPELAGAFEEKFGVRPVEGYGATELSPIAAGNVPIRRAGEHPEWTAREGTVGRPIPGVSAKTVHPDSGEDLPRGEAGRLLVSGPNVMLGYLHDEKQTAAVIRDGWYVTGDVARIDDDGFITITGRESRFSKIGGEMVPHVQIEETLAEIIDGETDGIRAAVTAVPDARKGERLVVVHTHIDASPRQLCEALAKRGLPNIFIPSPESFLEVDELPVLGTGKLDLVGIRQLARDAFDKQ